MKDGERDDLVYPGDVFVSVWNEWYVVLKVDRRYVLVFKDNRFYRIDARYKGLSAWKAYHGRIA